MASKDVTEMMGLQKYDTSADYDLPPQIPDRHKGYGAGKCGTYEIRIGSCSGKSKNPLARPIIFNPIVTLIGLVTLFAFAGYCIDKGVEAKTKLGEWQSWCTATFTWLYIGSQDIWIFFLIAVYYYYGDRKLGKDDDKPEFNNTSYFAMIFSAGVAVGLFVYGTAEPLYHYGYWYKHSLNGGSQTENDKANYAILTTIFHWGFHGFVVYSLVAVQMGLMCFRYNLPLTIRSCFYPILGRHTWGWIGDVIDGFSIVTIIAGVCTSLGLGAIQIRRGLEGLSVYKTADCDADCQDGWLLIIIWGITAIATVSVVSGLHIGIKTLSALAFYLGLFILGFVFFFGNTWFYLNVMVEQTGLYLHYALTVLGWRTDAFAQLPEGEGRATDGLGANQSFMDGWTIFYWGWWIAWSPFVGSFIARISRGRTIKEVLNFTLTVPLLFVIIWFSVFGGEAIRMEWKAYRLAQAGVELYNDPTVFQAGQHGNPQQEFVASDANFPVVRDPTPYNPECTAYAYNSALGDTICSTEKGWAAQQANAADCVPPGGVVGGAPVSQAGCGACFIMQANFGNDTNTACEVWADLPTTPARDIADCPAWIANWVGDTRFNYPCLFSWDQEASWYNVLGQFGDVAPFMQALSIVTLVFYFVTSSDSGSLMVDTLAANGRDEQNPLQRVMWAVIEGLVATGLVVGADENSSAKDVLKALQAASICAGLPFTILLCFMMPAMWYGLVNDGKKDELKEGFKVPIYGGVFDIFDTVLSLGKAPLPSTFVVTMTGISTVAPFLSLMRILQLMTRENIAPSFFGSQKLGSLAYVGTSIIGLLLFVIFHFLQLDDSDQGYWSMAWMFYLAFAMVIANIRYRVRLFRDIPGNFVEDASSAIFMYPCVLVQLLVELGYEPVSKSEPANVL